jgi:hypothetical protein
VSSQKLFLTPQKLPVRLPVVDRCLWGFIHQSARHRLGVARQLPILQPALQDESAGPRQSEAFQQFWQTAHEAYCSQRTTPPRSCPDTVPEVLVATQGHSLRGRCKETQSRCSTLLESSHTDHRVISSNGALGYGDDRKGGHIKTTSFTKPYTRVHDSQPPK